MSPLTPHRGSPASPRGHLSLDVVILTDYRGAFWSSTLNERTLTSMDVGKLASHLQRQGATVRVLEYADVDIRDDWSETTVIYTSAEDPGLTYKSFIEDVMLALDRKGARLLPDFDFLRAHHNKVYMELLRAIRLAGDPLIPDTRAYGTLEELRDRGAADLLPGFIKGAEGAGSTSVFLVKTPRELHRQARDASVVTAWSPREAVKSVVRSGYVKASRHRRKFIVQRQVPGLQGDFKVLRYGDRFYAARRHNRKGAMTASGSGLLDFDIERYVRADELLGFALSVADDLATPLVSMDVAHADGEFRLLEFQGIHFGAAVLESSNQHWLLTSDRRFTKVPSESILEDVFAAAVMSASRHARVQGMPQTRKCSCDC